MSERFGYIGETETKPCHESMVHLRHFEHQIAEFYHRQTESSLDIDTGRYSQGLLRQDFVNKDQESTGVGQLRNDRNIGRRFRS